ncbi:hypothetical protein KCP73_16920 [Salmonella enterica subsp. enterica]|nr:hypothetical protein KCP73_16920 [Salmonella enterica subsp. enterica]
MYKTGSSRGFIYYLPRAQWRQAQDDCSEDGGRRALCCRRGGLNYAGL